MAGQRVEVLEGRGGVEVEAELRELERDLAVETASGDLVDERVVGVGDGHRLGKVRQVLAQQREDAIDAPRLMGHGGVDGILGRLAGHEPPGRPPDPAEARQPRLEPAVAGRPEEDPSHGIDGTEPAADTRVDPSRIRGRPRRIRGMKST